jgi:hypothetical protein
MAARKKNTLTRPSGLFCVTNMPGTLTLAQLRKLPLYRALPAPAAPPPEENDGPIDPVEDDYDDYRYQDDEED